MRKFYPIQKDKFSACLSKIYAVKVCMNLAHFLLFLPCDFLCDKNLQISFISYNHSLEKVKKGKVKI